MIANGDNQDSFANLFFAGVKIGSAGAARVLSDEEGRNNEDGHRAKSRKPPRFKPSLPPPRWPLRQTRRNLLPHVPPIIVAGVRHWERIQGREHSFDSFQLRPALFASRQVLSNQGPLSGHAFFVCNQLFLGHVFHDSVPMALTCVPLPTKGCKASRNFCTARKTVFFAAPELDFRTSAISSIAQPSQCRITNAVLSEYESAARAISICLRNSMLCARRSGVGAASCTDVKGSFSFTATGTA